MIGVIKVIAQKFNNGVATGDTGCSFELRMCCCNEMKTVLKETSNHETMVFDRENVINFEDLKITVPYHYAEEYLSLKYCPFCKSDIKFRIDEVVYDKRDYVDKIIKTFTYERKDSQW